MNDNPRQPILLVEDNPDDQLLTRRAFTKNAIINPLVIANDGVEALALLHHATDPLRPALIMMDLKLPRMTGHELLRSIRSDDRTRRVPIVILTSSGEDNDIAESYNLHANSYIRKPVDFQEFHRVVGQVGLYWLGINTGAPERTISSNRIDFSKP
jgi:two-component system response regulator